MTTHIKHILATDRWMLPAAIVAAALIACITATIIAQQVEQASYDTRRAVWCAGRGERHVWASERTLCEEVTK